MRVLSRRPALGAMGFSSAFSPALRKTGRASVSPDLRTEESTKGGDGRDGRSSDLGSGSSLGLLAGGSGGWRRLDGRLGAEDDRGDSNGLLDLGNGDRGAANKSRIVSQRRSVSEAAKMIEKRTRQQQPQPTRQQQRPR